MNPQGAKRSLEYLCKRKVPVFLWGPPGIGKSSIVAQIAKEQDIACIDLRLSLLDPTDLRGIPFFDTNKDTAVWAPPSFLPDGSQKEGILFLDELNTAAPMVQASAYQLILDRKMVNILCLRVGPLSQQVTVRVTVVSSFVWQHRWQTGLSTWRWKAMSVSGRSGRKMQVSI